MERREETLREVLAKNEEEQTRWELYQRENEGAIENLDMFSKKLTIDVMVPIGSKALMPGQICHTNEVFISHFQGIFSMCSAFQAQTICQKRINMAKEQLEKLKREHEMFQNKLEIPQLGALPGEGENEIIEEYDEEKEKIWREEHKKRVREYKQKEREKTTEAIEKNHDDIDVMKMLEEMELMEELEKELEQLQVEDDETLQKIIAGEIKLPPEKARTSHYLTKSDVIIGDDVSDTKKDKKKEKSVVEEISDKYKNCNDSNLETTDFTNNNSIPNSQDFQHSGNDSDDPSDSEIPDEVSQVENETVHLSKSERLKVFKKSLKETEKSLQKLKIVNMDDLHRKAHLLEVREYFMDYVEILKDEVDESSEEEELKAKEIEISNGNSKSKKKKSIKFALEDQIKYIDNNSVEDIFIQKDNRRRDVVTLDNPLNSKKSVSLETPEIGESTCENPVVDKKAAILEKVERSCNFVFENQSQQDFNLIDKILNTEKNRERTLKITFNHSDKKFTYSGCETDSLEGNSSSESIIGSPADIYKAYINFSEDVEPSISEVAPMKKTNTNENAYEDLRIKILNQHNGDENKENKHNSNEQKIVSEVTKSILKNKDAVKQETHLNVPPKQKKAKKKKTTEENYAGFDAILGEVVENPITQPDPLPKEKFVDAHAPKKRISRFKQMRTAPT